ncbi:hypothetical protein FK521_27140 [Klebsiella pneumoniae]|nr:hypothetical protein [Klebsiella pneumoniae]
MIYWQMTGDKTAAANWLRQTPKPEFANNPESLTATSERSRRLSPPAFRYQLTELARKAGKRVVLPEGDEPRTI